MAFSGVFGGLHGSRMARGICGMGNKHSGGNKNMAINTQFKLDRHETYIAQNTRKESAKFH